MKNVLVAILIILLAALLVLLCYTWFIGPGVHVRIHNQADNDIYGYCLKYSFTGSETFRSTGDGSVTMLNRNAGSNIAYPLPEGKDIELPTHRREDIPFNEILTIQLLVFDKPIFTGEDGRTENATPVSGIYHIPVEEARCSDIVLKGNSTDGYTIEFIGISRKRTGD